MDLIEFRTEAVAIHGEAKDTVIFDYSGLEYHEKRGNNLSSKEKYKYYIDGEEVPRLEFLKEIKYL